jgi:hypothetical protein
MKKLLLICLVFAFVFAAERTEVDIEFTPKPGSQYDAPTTPSVPLIGQMTQAKLSGDMVAFEQLLQEYEKLAPRAGESNPVGAYTEAVNPEDYPIMRYGDDVTIYAGDVYWNTWAQLIDIDDEAISVDYHKGDTIIAAVACTDSLVRAFKSYDNGLTWSYVRWFSYGGAQLSEPEIIWGGGGWYHVFMRVSSGNGNLLNFNVASDESDYNVTMIENTSDSMHYYTVCSDKSDWTTAMYLYCAWHVGDGGVSADDIYFTRSYNDGANWDAPVMPLTNGAGWPDLTYGDDMLYLAFYGRQGSNHDIGVNRSTDLGNSWVDYTLVSSNTYVKQGPQVAASHSDSDHVWVVWPRKWSSDPYDYDLWFSWSTNAGANWSSASFASSWVDSSEILPSLVTFGSYGSIAHDPYLTYANVLYDFSTDVNVYLRGWDDTNDEFDDPYDYSDNPSELTRPMQTYDNDAGTPAFAYVGDNGVNVYFDGWFVSVEEQDDGLAVSNELSGIVHPNPFTSMTNIAYNLPSTERITAKVYNTLGQTVTTLIDGVQQSGKHELQWNAAGLPRGVYFLKLETENAAVTKKVIIE